MQHDELLDIATGRGKNEAHWKNRKSTWAALAARLSKTQYTHETVKEYAGMPKPMQDNIKDVGAFVGGYLDGGIRKTNRVLHRQILTLDIDFGTVGAWSDFIMMYDNAAVMYSTHKHAEGAERLRLVMPLSRPVNRIEYQAIGRRIAGNVDIEIFDNTGFQPQRLMYWPSTSKDGVFDFYQQEGPWLDVEEVLASYTSWQDASAWPVSIRVSKSLRTAMTKQGDPLEKPGVVGAFCRCNTIAEAIEKHLADVYEPCDTPDRYTYIGGTTSAGLVEYEGVFAYSHHGTDPCSGILCNAYDLVRLHKFGHLDEGQAEDTPINRKASYLAMLDYARQQDDVRLLITQERTSKARAEFADELDDVLDGEAVEVSDEWMKDLQYDRSGNITSTIGNALLILNNDPNLAGRLAYNEFDKREVALKNLPWRKIEGYADPLTDRDDAGLRNYIETTYGIGSGGKIQDALILAIHDNRIHPVKEYLSGLTWDGVERLDTLMVDYLGAEDTPYARAVTRKTFIAGVARIFTPGCKHDHVLTIIGPEGIGKSRILHKMGGEWFSDSLTTVIGKEAYEQIQGCWLVEIAELSAFRKGEDKAVKHFTSKQEDIFRVAYGKRTEKFRRQCFFIATSNEDEPLQGDNGNRRFWPLRVGVNPHKDAEEVPRDMVLAEAVVRFKAGEDLYLSADMEAEARGIQADYTERDNRAGMIEEYLNTKLPENWEKLNNYQRRGWLIEDDPLIEGTRPRVIVCAAEIWVECLGNQVKDMTTHNTKFIHGVMSRFPGWKRGKSKRHVTNYGKQNVYYVPNSVADVEPLDKAGGSKNI